MFFFVALMKEIEMHFEHPLRASGDEPRCRANALIKQEVCAFHHNLSHRFFVLIKQLVVNSKKDWRQRCGQNKTD